jgi:hypothetical protein
MKKKEVFKIETDDLNVKGKFNKMRIIINSHFYINLTEENDEAFVEFGATHHGVKFNINNINGEFEKVINFLREKYKNNITD